ncbi:Predicted arabinose efflux permease, MFS family [Caenispirillum bisanense]|uniref:Predicted arabinose efflux permease, MFS family n=2 Tax=Caenispirillum bisanense TaxID=414052 RepID=A0A286GUJ1_9PROT|nr:Predicted arabinose efflux permease, MFS family [Caenispirillum bisanense]
MTATWWRNRTGPPTEVALVAGRRAVLKSDVREAKPSLLLRKVRHLMPALPASARLPLGSVIARVFLPFALGYFLSYLYRSVNAVISPYLRTDVGLEAADLGLLTSAYFLAFALAQLPIGVALDRMGPRLVEAFLLLFATAGAVLFAVGQDTATLVAGRALIGLGVAACLMSALKSMTQWFPLEKLPLVNGIVVASGGLGALAATAPTELIVDAVGWRPVFWGLAAVTLACAVILVVVVPEKRREGAHESLIDSLRTLGAIFRSRAFWRIAPAVAMNQGGFMAIQGLWAGPWLRDVAGLSKPEAASVLLLTAAAMVGGQLGLGIVAERAGRVGVKPLTVFAVGMGLFITAEALLALGVVSLTVPLWIAFGFFGTVGILCYAVLSRQFSAALAGRTNTSLNLTMFAAAFAFQWGMGAIIGQWPQDAAGAYPPAAYSAAIGTVVVLQTLAWGWLIVSGWRERA